MIGSSEMQTWFLVTTEFRRQLYEDTVNLHPVLNSQLTQPEMAKTADMGLKNLMPNRVARFLSETSGLPEAMESMHAQWRDIEKSASSFASFVELQSIGLGLENIPAFDDSLAAALRSDLGDWRDSISWKPEIFAEEAARSSLYEGLGFNR